MNSKSVISKIPSVNFHLWEPCNMRCKFCFATFQDVKQSILPKGHLSKNESLEVVRKLAEYGFEKITFAGGEPTLCSWLSDLIRLAKELGMTTMIVTNGTKLTDYFLSKNKNYLDWIALSIDSLNDKSNLKAGRAINGKKIITESDYIKIIEKIKQYDYKFKINTVVNSSNFDENLSDFVTKINPKRWKVLQVLLVEGQNDNKVDDFLITQKQFDLFLSTHKHIKSLVPETNEAIKGSYVMLDPAGRFFDNQGESYIYSESVLDVEVNSALQEVNYDTSKFIKRGGIYNWK